MTRTTAAFRFPRLDRAFGTYLRRVRLVAVALVLAGSFGRNLAAHVRLASDEKTFNDDVRQQIYPFFRYTGTATPAADIAADYQLALLPLAYRALYQGLAPLVDPERVSKWLPYLLFIVMLTAVARVAYTIGGLWTAALTLALAFETSVFLNRMTGGLPRGFAFALVALGLWALVAGRGRWLAVLAMVAAGFYSVAAAILGLMLAGLLFVLPAADRGDVATWSVRRRLTALLLVSAIVGGALLPVAVTMRAWGRLLGPGDVRAYPEIGPTGRYAVEDMIAIRRVPVEGLLQEMRRSVSGTLTSTIPWSTASRNATSGMESAIIGVLLTIITLGLISRARHDRLARRALLLPLAGVAGHVLATVLAPALYLPQRYLSFTMPLALVVLLPLGGAACGQLFVRARHAPCARLLGAGLTAGAVIVLLGGPGAPSAGYTVRVAPDAQIYAFIRQLPSDVLIAGWPGDVMDNVPYVSRRRVFLNHENHQVFHEGYVLEMRARMHVLIGALFAETPEALRALRDTYGVTHLAIDVQHYGSAPGYFAPFGDEVRATWARGLAHGFASQSVVGRASVFREGTLILLDLSRL